MQTAPEGAPDPCGPATGGSGSTSKAPASTPRLAGTTHWHRGTRWSTGETQQAGALSIQRVHDCPGPSGSRSLRAPWAARFAGPPGQTRDSGSPVREAGAGEDDSTGFGPRTANARGASPEGNPAPVGHTRPRAEVTDGRSGDGHFVTKRSASWSSEHETGSQRARTARLIARPGKPRRTPTAGSKPQEWQRLSKSRSGRGVNRRGGEKPRGRNVPGEASPGIADPVAHVVEGAPNSTRGIRGLRSRDRRCDLCLERAVQACGSHRECSHSRSDGRRKTSRS